MGTTVEAGTTVEGRTMEAATPEVDTVGDTIPTPPLEWCTPQPVTMPHGFFTVRHSTTNPCTLTGRMSVVVSATTESMVPAATDPMDIPATVPDMGTAVTDHTGTAATAPADLTSVGATTETRAPKETRCHGCIVRACASQRERAVRSNAIHVRVTDDCRKDERRATTARE